MLDWPVLSPESKDSPRTVSAGESLLEKRGQEFYSRDAEAVPSSSRQVFVASPPMHKNRHGLASDCLVEERFELV